jgi:DNA repair protein RecO (recombination protein O)
MVDRFTVDGQELPGAYDLLSRSLDVLDHGIRPWLVLRHFDLALLTLLGYRPELYRCVNCESELSAEANALSPRHGGMLCARCRSSDLSATEVGLNGQKLMRTLDRAGLAEAVTLRFDDQTRAEVERSLGSFIRNLLDRELASPRVVRSIQEGLGDAYLARS